MKYICYISFCTAVSLFASCSNQPSTVASALNQTDSNDVSPTPLISITDSTRIGTTKIDTLLYAVFLALKSKNSDAFMKLTPTRKEIEQVYLSMAPADKKEMVKQKLQEENISIEERQAALEAFQRAVKRGGELKINWGALTYKKITIDSAIDHGLKTYKGEMTLIEGTRTFHIKYDDCLNVGNKYVITNIYTPYEELANQNRSICEKYKVAYIRSCIRSMKKSPKELLMGLSPEKYCSCSYKQIIKESSCEDFLKDTIHLQVRSGNCKE